MKVAAVILAAGASTRLGEAKQLAIVAGERLLERAMRVAAEAGCAPIVVVLGADAERVRSECRLGSARIVVVVNDAWREGMAASIRAGIAAVAAEAGADAVAAIVMTCDQPAVTAEHLGRLRAACIDQPVASAYAGRRGVPACFPASCFGQLLLLDGDTGARTLLATAETVELAGGEMDVDTTAALELARSVYG